MEQSVKNCEKTVIQREETLENARFWKTSFYTFPDVSPHQSATQAYSVGYAD